MQKIFPRLAVTAFTLLSLSACNLYVDPYITPNRIEVRPEQVSEQRPVSEIDDQYLAGMATDFLKNGEDTMEISITYDPRSSSASARRAQGELTRIKNGLARHGVKSVNGDVLPVQGQGDEIYMLATYNSYVALPPTDCKTMDGFENRALTLDNDYRQGCTVETLMTRQIANPKDLMGDRAHPATTDGRRASVIGERYRSGMPNPALGGESASGQ